MSRIILFIKADASPRIGTGHIMRCIALGQAWRDKGGGVTFVSHCESEALKNRIVEEGFSLIRVATPHPAPSDVEHTLKILADSGNETWLVLDGYHFDPAYQTCIRDAGYRLLVIDDMNHLPFYNADIILNQNIYAPDLQYKCNKDTIQLLGSKYVLLRREFLEYGRKKKPPREKAENILVTMGGADPDNVTQKVIKALKLIAHRNFQVKVIAGPANQFIEGIKNQLIDAPFEHELLTDTFDMPALMFWADIAITAAGSTCWEFAFMNVPILCFVVAKNQELAAKTLHKYKRAFSLDFRHRVSIELISKMILKLLNSYGDRNIMANRTGDLVDGLGAFRVCNKLIEMN